jgi:hypothetical protein
MVGFLNNAVEPSPGGNRLPFGDQESVSGNAQTRVVMEAAPPASFKVSKPDLLLEFKIVALDPPTQLGGINQAAEADVCRPLESQYFVCSFSPSGHSIKSHSSGQGSLRSKSRLAMRMR